MLPRGLLWRARRALQHGDGGAGRVVLLLTLYILDVVGKAFAVAREDAVLLIPLERGLRVLPGFSFESRFVP